MSDEEIIRLHKKYAPSDDAFQLVYDHCKIVAKIALACLDSHPRLNANRETVYLASMLHDIGTYTLFMPELHTFKEDGYQQHALIGATLLDEEGLPKEVTAAVRTHVLMGITAAEIKAQQWKLPYHDYVPATIEAELLCYADRFHSKHPRFNHPETFLAHLEKDLPEQAVKFRQAMQRFGLPDLEKLVSEYGHQTV